MNDTVHIQKIINRNHTHYNKEIIPLYFKYKNIVETDTLIIIKEDEKILKGFLFEEDIRGIETKLETNLFEYYLCSFLKETKREGDNKEHIYLKKDILINNVYYEIMFISFQTAGLSLKSCKYLERDFILDIPPSVNIKEEDLKSKKIKLIDSYSTDDSSFLIGPSLDVISNEAYYKKRAIRIFTFSKDI